MSAEDAYSLLDCTAKISGTIDRLKKMKPEGHEMEDEIIAAEVNAKARRGPFKFSECNIHFGEVSLFLRMMILNDIRLKIEKK